MSLIHRLITQPIFGGILLIITTFTAIIMVNCGNSELYKTIVYFPTWLNDDIYSQFTVLNITNEGLMALFFLAVSLEIKRELLKGVLNSRIRASFPIIAALGGMVVPAIIYSLITYNFSKLQAGWAIPIATDITFVVSVLSLLGNRVPSKLKIFLLALAIVDDLGAIVIIALYYSNTLELISIAITIILTIVMVLMNRANVSSNISYLLVGIILWGFILSSGIHATLAGVIVGALIPLSLPGENLSPSHILERRLQPWIIYLIMPLFAFVNSGILLKGITFNHLISPLPLGIVLGLVLGKPVGIILFSAISIKLKLASLPSGITFHHIFSAAFLCGIGFTMSIFITNLAFGHDSTELILLAKTGILSGSIIAALLGYTLLKVTLSQK